MATIATNPSVFGENRISFRATWETNQFLAEAIGEQHVLLAYDGEMVELMSPGIDHEDLRSSSPA